MRNLEEFQARYPMSRAELLTTLQGQEIILHKTLWLFRWVRSQKNVKNSVLDYASDMVHIENETMKALLAHV